MSVRAINIGQQRPPARRRHPVSSHQQPQQSELGFLGIGAGLASAIGSVAGAAGSIFGGGGDDGDDAAAVRTQYERELDEQQEEFQRQQQQIQNQFQQQTQALQRQLQQQQQAASGQQKTLLYAGGGVAALGALYLLTKDDD